MCVAFKFKVDLTLPSNYLCRVGLNMSQWFWRKLLNSMIFSLGKRHGPLVEKKIEFPLCKDAFSIGYLEYITSFLKKKILFKVVDSLSVLSFTHMYGHPSLVMQQGTSLSICPHFLNQVLCGIFTPCRVILSSLQAYIRFYCYKLHINCR